MGNLIAFKAGTGPAPRLKVMVSAHMDEIGFMVLQVEKGGMLRFGAVGGLNARMLIAKRVLIGDDRLSGVIGMAPPHLTSTEQRERVLDVDDLSIDVGAENDKGAESKVKVGDYGTFATRFAVLSDDPAWPTVHGKAFDDRVGCTALIGLLAGHYPVDLYAVFTVQEEVGLRGHAWQPTASSRMQPSRWKAPSVTTRRRLPMRMSVRSHGLAPARRSL